MAQKKTAVKNKKSFEETLWESANKLRGAVEPAEYKHVVLSLIFLKFASDKFVARRQEIMDEGQEPFVDMVEFYTPKSIVNLIAELIEPYKGKIYDPCCGSGGMFAKPGGEIDRLADAAQARRFRVPARSA